MVSNMGKLIRLLISIPGMLSSIFTTYLFLDMNTKFDNFPDWYYTINDNDMIQIIMLVLILISVIASKSIKFLGSAFKVGLFVPIPLINIAFGAMTAIVGLLILFSFAWAFDLIYILID